MYIRDQLIDLDHRLMLATDPYALQTTLNRWRASLAPLLEGLTATAQAATDAFRGLAEALREGIARDIQQHPDLAELDAKMDGFYSPET